MTPTAILVLGSRVRAGGSAGPALARRLDRAVRAATEWPDALVVVCGGRSWDGVVEADVMARALVGFGVDVSRIVRERLSMSTIENLREASSLLRARGRHGVIALVSCDWHLPRALRIAEVMGFTALACPATAPTVPLARRAARALRERLLRAVVPLLVILIVACRKPAPTPSDAGAPVASASVAPSVDLVAARVAADRRHTEGVPPALSSGEAADRRSAARALSQIGDAAAIERLGRTLSDDDPEVIAWSAYGLGLPCDLDPDLSREDRAKIVRAIVARAVGLEGVGSAPLDPWAAMGWTLGRCGGIDASRELARWLGKDPSRARAAAWALGSIASRDKGLEDDVVKALLDAARAGLDDALFPFGRGDWSNRPPSPGLADVARARLSSARLFAIRALGRAAGAKPEDLRVLLTDPKTVEGERIEALRSLHRMGAAGDAEVAAFATRHAPTDEAHSAALLGPAFGAVRVAIDLLGERDPTPTTTTSLRAFVVKAAIPATASASLARRLATLRCAAAAALHPGKPGEAEVVRCAAHDPSLPAPLRAELDAIRDLARLQTLDRADIVGEKRDLLVKLARDAVHRVRQRALSILGKHAETEEAPDVIIKALASKSLGVVATAAQALTDRPSIAFVLSKKAIDKALDPTSPPPDKVVVNADRTVDPKVLEALDGALARPMEEADGEIKTALAAAVGALKHGKGRGFVMRLCGDRSPALRRAGRDALSRLDPPGKGPTCATIDDHGVASPYASLPGATRTLKVETDAGTMEMKLDPSFAPIAVARVAELAASGFYDNTPIHRVVPGFVVQLGDPNGDGYGGAHTALRCETAPVPFAEGDIGVALAGRDTGSSQIFVMLGRAPHLDGSYARIGHASGEWVKIAEGDHVIKVTVQ